MNLTPDRLRKLGALGLTVEQIAGTVEIFTESEPPNSSRAAPGAESEPSPPIAQTAPVASSPRPAPRSKETVVSFGRAGKAPGESVDVQVIDPFDDFWLRYPKKVKKSFAAKAYLRAVDAGLTVEQIAAQLTSFLANDPAAAKEVNPSTFLNMLTEHHKAGTLVHSTPPTGQTPAAEPERDPLEIPPELVRKPAPDVE